MYPPLFFVTLYVALASAHLCVWHKSMYCLDGTSGKPDENASQATTPLYNLNKDQWWFHHVDGCDNFPPKDGEFLELPAGKDFTVEIAANRAVTSLSYNGKYVTDWVDGKNYPDNFSKSTGCITTPNIHTQNETMAAGTAFAISYQSDIKKVTPDNLVVFSVRYHTPWKRLTTYSVPKAMPACPKEGCICAWGWVPNGCGEPNMYHQGFRCKVTGATATAPVAVPKAPVWCEDDPSKCTKGAKQMIYWNQKEGNNILVSGNDRASMPKSPAYNAKLGFLDGAQNDIFAPPSQGGGNNAPNPSPDPTTTKSSPSPSISNSGPEPSPESGSDSGSGSKPNPDSDAGVPPAKPPSGPTNEQPSTTPSPTPPTSSPSNGAGSGQCAPKKKHRKRPSTSFKKRGTAQHRRRDHRGTAW
jgi:hypothetical protein